VIFPSRLVVLYCFSEGRTARGFGATRWRKPSSWIRCQHRRYIVSGDGWTYSSVEGDDAGNEAEEDHVGRYASEGVNEGVHSSGN
jgi:hypothetical protein